MGMKKNAEKIILAGGDCKEADMLIDCHKCPVNVTKSCVNGTDSDVMADCYNFLEKSKRLPIPK